MVSTDTELRKIFNAYDKDGSGKIDIDELTTALAQGGKAMSRAEVENIVKLVDKNNVRSSLALACSPFTISTTSSLDEDSIYH